MGLFIPKNFKHGLPNNMTLVSDLENGTRSLAWTHHPDKGGSPERRGEGPHLLGRCCGEWVIIWIIENKMETTIMGLYRDYRAYIRAI